MGKSYRLAGLAAAVAMALVIPASAADETYQQAGHVVVPGNPLLSFDISWVDTDINEYFLADRSNQSIDVVPLQQLLNPPVFQIKPTGIDAFAGPVVCGGVANVCAGPNGVLTLNNVGPTGTTKELWVGDGPTPNPACPISMPTCSTVKVFAGNDAHLTHTIATGGAFRADELCFDPNHRVVMIANDADNPPFVSFIPTSGSKAYTVAKKISFPEATNGIGQCQWSPVTGLIYLNIPEVHGHGNDTAPGAVYVFDGSTMSLTNALGSGGKFPINITQCAGPQGMATGLAPTTGILLGCSAPSLPSGVQNSVIVDALNPSINLVTLANLGGADEVYLDKVSAQYFLALGSLLPSQILGIVDADGSADQSILMGVMGGTRRAHSVAAWSGTPGRLFPLTAAILPVPPVGGGPTPFISTLCGSDAAVGCIAFFVTSPIPNPFVEFSE